ncbi:MAG TPA: TonB-dependent receptor, partial [Ferruginibacter sp.]|nr:TonB-dependent receptor [Ferruginibacter sp.]
TLVTNYSSLHEVNLHYWQSQRFKQWGYTFMTGYTGQRASDVNEDGFSDLPRLQSLQLHPSLFWYPDSKTIIKFSYHYTGEQRTGGDMLALDQTSLDHTFFEANMLQRHNLAAQISRRINQQQSILVKASLGSFQQQQRSDSMLRSGRQQNLFTEASWLYEKGNMHLIGGLNLYGLKFNPTTRGYLFGSFRQFSEGVFTQLTESISRNSTLEVGFRLDHNQAYGYFPLPRLALFHRFNEHWGSRLGIGWGYSLPTPFVSFYRETDPGKLEALSDQIRAEHSIGYNAEINYRMHWKQNRLFINQAFFLTDVKNPLQLGVRSNGSQYLYNQDGPMRSAGTDTYIQLALGEWEFYFGYSKNVRSVFNSSE